MTRSFRELMARDGPAILAGAHNGLSARLVEGAGFDAVWASSFEISAANAVPDAGILGMGECLPIVANICDSAAIPTLVDVDTGYGNAMNVVRLVKAYERVGVGGICIEDNLYPKRCSLWEGMERTLETTDEMAAKLRAAKDARLSPDFIVVARIEALIAGLGQDEAIRRAVAYDDAGADVIMIHSTRSTPDEVFEFARRWGEKSPMLVVPTKFKEVTADALYDAGFKFVVFANHGLRGAIKGMKDAFAALARERKTAAADPHIVSLDEVYRLEGVDAFQAGEKKYAGEGEED